MYLRDRIVMINWDSFFLIYIIDEYINRFWDSSSNIYLMISWESCVYIYTHMYVLFVDENHWESAGSNFSAFLKDA
jgi:hypothetical protein